jgi:hypothetical protein
MIFGTAQVRYLDPRLEVDTTAGVTVVTPLAAGPVAADWSAATAIDIDPSDLETNGTPGVGFMDLPANVVTSRSVDAWKRDFVTWVYGSQALDLRRSPQSGVVSNPGESERDFRIRLQQASREARDRAVDELRRKYAPKTAAAGERLRRAQQAVTRESEQAQSQTMQTAISFGTTLLGAFLGRKAVSAGTLGRATTAARGVGRTLKESQDIARAKETVETVQQQLRQLDEALQSDIAAVEARFDPAAESLETVSCRPKKANIDVRLVALVWAPCVVASDGRTTPAW